MNIDLNTTSTSEHVPDIERQIYVIKKISRSCHHTIPFNHIPKVIQVSLFMNCALWINVLPQKLVVSTSVSPCIILTEVNFDYNKHCRLQFFQYAQLYQEKTPTNSQASKTSRAIFFRPSIKYLRGYKFFGLRTGRKITHRSYTALPMPSAVFDQVNHIGLAEVQP